MRAVQAHYVKLLIVLLSFSAVPARAQSAELEVLKTVQQLFDGMAQRDTVALKSVLTAEGRFTVVVVGSDSTTLRATSHAEFIARIGAEKRTLLERMWDPKVLIEGPFAAVWTPYDFHIDGKFSHCGTDVFTLVKQDQQWRISGASYTIARSGCAPSPLGPPHVAGR